MSAARPALPESGSQTLARGLRALELIAEAEPKHTVASLAQALGIHRSMVYRLVNTLEQFGFVLKLPSGELEVGARLASLAQGAGSDLQSAAMPKLAGLADELGMTAFLVVFDGTEAVTLANALPQNAAATVAQRPGSRHAIGQGAPGRVIRSMLDPAGFPAAPYEYSHDEVLPGLASIAVPLMLPHGQAAAIAVLYLVQEVDRDATARRIVAAAASIRAALR